MILMIMTFLDNITLPNTVSWGNLLITVFAAPNLDRKQTLKHSNYL
jgi:hypothetical protein